MSNLFKRDLIQQAIKNFSYETVSTEEWSPGTAILVWQLSAAEQTKVDAAIAKYVKTKTNRRGETTVLENNSAQAGARIALFCCRDEQRNPVFIEDDIATLIECPQICLTRIVEAYHRLNNTTNEDIEDLVKNSGKSPT